VLGLGFDDRRFAPLAIALVMQRTEVFGLFEAFAAPYMALPVRKRMKYQTKPRSALVGAPELPAVVLPT
jgi:hypothetical protein